MNEPGRQEGDFLQLTRVDRFVKGRVIDFPVRGGVKLNILDGGGFPILQPRDLLVTYPPYSIDQTETRLVDPTQIIATENIHSDIEDYRRLEELRELMRTGQFDSSKADKPVVGTELPGGFFAVDLGLHRTLAALREKYPIPIGIRNPRTDRFRVRYEKAREEIEKRIVKRLIRGKLEEGGLYGELSLDDPESQDPSFLFSVPSMVKGVAVRANADAFLAQLAEALKTPEGEALRKIAGFGDRLAYSLEAYAFLDKEEAAKRARELLAA